MPGKMQDGSFYGWWLLPILCLVYSIPIGFALYGPPVINTFMADSLKWPRGEINLGYSIIGLMLGIGALLVPWMMNRYGPRKTLAIGAVIAAISSILVSLLGHISLTFNGHIYPVAYWVICFFVGLGVSFGTVVLVQALVMLWFNVRRALAMGLVLGGGAIGGFIYPQIISAAIVNSGGDWHAGWYVIAMACFIGAAIAMLAVRNGPEELGQHPDGLSPEQLQEAMKHTKHKLIKTYRSPVSWPFRDAIKTRALWSIVIAIGFIFYLWQTILTQTPAHLRDRGFSPSDPVLIFQPAFVYGLILAFSIIGRLSVSFLGERIEPRYIISMAGVSLLIGGAFFWLASRENLWAVYLYPLFTGFGFGATYVCQPLIIGNYFGVGSFPVISRISSPIGSIFQYSAPAVAGFIYDINGSYATAVIVGCTGALIGLLLILFSVPPKPVKLEA